MVSTSVKCPHCGSDNVKKNGTSRNGKQRFLCGNEKCRHKTFVEHYTYNAYDPNIRSRIFFSIVNGSGTRATARTLSIAKDTVTDALRSEGKESFRQLEMRDRSVANIPEGIRVITVCDREGDMADLSPMSCLPKPKRRMSRF
jgi:transposase-like protein